MTLAPAAARGAAVEAIERLLEDESEADHVLRRAVAVLADALEGARWVGIAFVEEGALALGPSAGEAPPDPSPPAVRQPVEYDRAPVAELWIETAAEPDDEDRAFLQRVAALLSPYCLVGWDTGGEDWVNE